VKVPAFGLVKLTSVPALASMPKSVVGRGAGKVVGIGVAADRAGDGAVDYRRAVVRVHAQVGAAHVRDADAVDRRVKSKPALAPVMSLMSNACVAAPVVRSIV
jgi:hypothetical protein